MAYMILVFTPNSVRNLISYVLTSNQQKRGMSSTINAKIRDPDATELIQTLYNDWKNKPI